MTNLRLTRRGASCAWLMMWSVAVSWVVVTSMPNNPLSPGFTAERETRLVMPEGWGFFTRDPREKDLIIAQRDHSGAWELEPPHASAKNGFGLLRMSRVLPVEANQVLAVVKGHFTSCKNDLQSCLEAAPIHDVAADASRPFLCGDVAFVRRAPVAWAWARLLKPEQMPTDVLRTQIRCNHEQP